MGAFRLSQRAEPLRFCPVNGATHLLGHPGAGLHHNQEETIHVLKGQYKIRVGDDIFRCEEGAFACLPSRVPHAFLNLTDEPGEIVVVYTPGGGHKFYEELGPISRGANPDRHAIAAD